MKNNDESTHIGTKKRRLRDEEISSVMEAMPIPRGWNMTQPPAKGNGNLRLAEGAIYFVKLNISINERIISKNKVFEPQPLSPVDFDPADRILKSDQRRKVHSRESNIDLFDLERRIKSVDSIDSGRYASIEGRRLASVKYRSKKQAEKIRADLNLLIKRLKFNLFEVSTISAFLVAIDLISVFGLSLPGIRTPEDSTTIYPIISLIGLLFTAIISFSDIKEGVKGLLTRNFNTLTALSAAVLAELIHLICMLATSFIAHRPVSSTFAAPVCVAVLVYTVNRLMHTVRVAHGFAYASKKGIHSEIMAADDSPIAADLRRASGIRNIKIAYVVRTRHLSNYFTNAFREDRCSIMMSNLYPAIMILSLAAAVIAAVRGYFTDSDPINAAFSALCSALVIGIPITGLLNMEIPLSRIARRLRRHNALLTGWNAVDKFGDTDAFAINTTDLFPRGSIRVRKSFAVNDMEIEEITSVAASVLMDSGGALAEVFGELIRDDPRLRQRVDSITYETELGIAAWVKDKKVLIGNRNMMELHRVLIPGGGLARLDEFEAMRKNECFQMLYVSVNNRLMGVYMLEYKAAMSARGALLQLIDDGACIMVYTCDSNINIQLIKSVFDISPRFISILDNEGSSVYDSVTFKVTESQEALIATDGSLKALAAAIRGATVLRDIEGMSLMIQSICFVIGFAFVAGLSCISPFAIDSVQILILQLVFILLSTVSVLRSL